MVRVVSYPCRKFYTWDFKWLSKYQDFRSIGFRFKGTLQYYNCFTFTNLPAKYNTVYVTFVGCNLAVSHHLTVCNYWLTNKMSHAYDWSSFKILLPWPRCFLSYRLLTESEREFLSRPPSCYFALYRNIFPTKAACSLNVCYCTFTT